MPTKIYRETAEKEYPMEREGLMGREAKSQAEWKEEKKTAAPSPEEEMDVCE